MESEGAEIQAQSDHAEPMKNKDNPESTKGSSSKKRKQREFAFPVSDRPARERKSIERLIVSPDKEVKEFKIQKGSGTALKNIPNIVFKLSKRRKGDEVVQALHKVLFGKSSSKHPAKANILQFSGFVWSGNEEKEKAKVKERLERCIKENLFQISDLLDLSLSKSLKKEDGVLKIFEFLESPYKTTDKLVEETAKSKKGKKAKKSSVKGSKVKASGKSPKKVRSRKGGKKTSRKKQTSDEEDESDAAEFDDDIQEEPEDRSDDDYVKESSSSKKRKRKSPKKEAVQESEDEEETLPTKKKRSKDAKKGKKEPIQKAKKEKKPKEKVLKVEEPSDEDLREAICELLQHADFSKVTFTDVLKQLGQEFKADLTHRKALLKAMIHEEIHKLAGDEDEDGNNEGEIDDNGDKANRDEQEEHEDASGDVEAEVEEHEDASGDVKAEDEEHEDASGDVKADDEDEDGDGNAAEGDADEEDGDDEKADGDDEEDQNRIDDKGDGEDEVEDAKEEGDHEAGAEEDMTDMV